MKKNKQFSKHSKTQSTAAARPAAVLCVTGASQVLLDPVFEQLVHAGLVRALPSEGRKGISIERWHEEVLSQLPDDVAVDDDFTPGRFWDQMASDIFMANFQDAVGSSARGIDDANPTDFDNATVNAWGWSDANSVELLPYWAGFHPQLRFLLVLTSPEYLLARLIDDGEPETDYLGALRDWHWRTEQVLGFYHRHAARCELVFADQALQNTWAICDRLSSKWGCALAASDAQTLEKENTAGQTTNPQHADIAENTSNTERLVSVGFESERDQIVARVLSLLPEVVSLQRELLATVPSLVEIDDEIVTDVVTDAVTNIHDQILAVDVVQDVDHANWQPIGLDDDIDLPDALLRQITTYQHRLGLFFSVQQEKEAAIRQLEVQIKQQQETLATEQKKLDAEIASAKAAKQAHELLEKSHQALESEMQQSQGLVKEAEEENELLLAQLHQVQEELEKYFLKSQESESKTAELEKGKQALEASAKKQSAELVELNKDKEAVAAQLKVAQEKLQQTDKAHKAVVTKWELEVKTSQSKTAELDKSKEALEASEKKQAAELAQLKKDQEALAAQLKVAQEKLQQTDKAHKAAVAKLELEVKDAKVSEELQAILKDTEEENELLLAQLHQVQEELEKYFLKSQESESKTAELEKGKQAFEASAKKQSAELVELNKDKEAVAAQLKVAQEKLQQTDKAHKAVVTKWELEVKTSQSKTAELDKSKEALEASEKKQAAELAQLKKDQEALAAQLKVAQEKLQLADKTHKAAVAKLELEVKEAKVSKELQALLKDTEEENELLLAQLHQVQEELERYFLKAQELEQSQETLQVRWQRLAGRYLGLCDYKGIEWLEAESDEDRHVWQITDFVDASGREMASLRFEILSQDGFVGFGFRREDGALLYWPTANTAMVESASKKDTNQKNTNQKNTNQNNNQNDDHNNNASTVRLDLVAGRSAKALQNFAAGLESLSTADWGFLSTVTDLMVEQYEQWVQEQDSEQTDSRSDIKGGYLEDNPIVPWLNGLKQFAKVLESLPTVLRFDGIRVVSSDDEGDYAHLALVLNNLSTDSGVHPEFEFRVATVSSGSVFDANPRLEFPRRTGEDVFERWFVESSNAFGENLEIRFAKDGSLVDLPLLLRVAEADKQLMTQLIDRLPGVISAVVAGRAVGAVSSESAADRAADRVLGQTASSTLEISNMSKPAVSVSPSVGHLTDRDVERWLAVTGTIRSIWHRQVPPPMIETAPVKSSSPASGKKQGLAGQTIDGGSVMGEIA